MNYQIYNKGELIKEAISILDKKGKLKVSDADVIKYTKDTNLKAKLIQNKNSAVRLDEIEYEVFPRALLKSIGYIHHSTDSIIFYDPILKKYNFDLSDIQIEIMQEFNNFLAESVRNCNENNNTIYPHLFLEKIIENYGSEYFKFALEIVKCFEESYISSPSYHKSKYDDINSINLKDLYELEDNNSFVGEFFDKRYIDFLKVNYNKVDDIHWRKFEELSAQFYRDNGYEVTIGSGRKDGGSDVIARKGNEYIIIQCKRLKGNVGVGTIKELHDDVSYHKSSLNEDVEGVIFCNNDISKDSKKLINERKYTNIKVFNREDIIKRLETY